VTGPIVDWRAEAFAARDRLSGRVIRTPSLTSATLDELVGARVISKAEALQHTGSFKVRGALNRLLTLTEAELGRGLITVSAGNAALGTAYAARQVGAQLTVVMPENAVPEKLRDVLALGADVVNAGVTSSAIAFDRARSLQAQHGWTFVHPYDDPMVIAGASTATQELLTDHPDLSLLLVPCSGGGLISGAIVAAQALESPVTIVGLQPELADGMVLSLRAGAPVAKAAGPTVADGLTAPQPGAVNFGIIKAAGVDVFTVSEEQILSATHLLISTLRVVVEPSAAVGLAALLASDEMRAQHKVGLLLSGSNVRAELLADLLRRA
jgi:threonine dehydratase